MTGIQIAYLIIAAPAVFCLIALGIDRLVSWASYHVRHAKMHRWWHIFTTGHSVIRRGAVRGYGYPRCDHWRCLDCGEWWA